MQTTQPIQPVTPIKETYYYVMRTHSSHTAKTRLVKVCSRGIKAHQAAVDWLSYCEHIEKNKEHKFFIIQTDSEVVL
jgi:hypothetical protein